MKREFKKGKNYIILSSDFLVAGKKYDCVVTDTGAIIFQNGAKRAILYGDYVALRAADLAGGEYVAVKDSEVVNIYRRDIYLRMRQNGEI